MALCKQKGCKKFAVANGKCEVHNSAKSYKKDEEVTAEPVILEVKVLKSTKDAYYGGAANEPHVHVYPGGGHLKLGADRYNLVQNGKVYTGKVEEADEALKDHPLRNQLKPWVDALITYFS